MSAPIPFEVEVSTSSWDIARTEKLLVVRASDYAALEAQIAALPANWLEDSSLKTWFPFTAEELASLKVKVAALEAQVQTLKAQLAAYNTSGFADADAMASAYLDMRVRAESAEANLENARKANRTWRCFHCDFTTSNGDEALAHFGDRDNAGEFQADQRIAALEQQVHTLREALRGCSHGSLKAGPCWCSHDHGMHDSWCIEARAALAATEKEKA